MNLSDLTDLFGTGAPWIASLAMLFLASIIIAAFLQGRAISIWPPRIGPHPDARPSPPDEEARPIDPYRPACPRRR